MSRDKWFHLMLGVRGKDGFIHHRCEIKVKSHRLCEAVAAAKYIAHHPDIPIKDMKIFMMEVFRVSGGYEKRWVEVMLSKEGPADVLFEV